MSKTIETQEVLSDREYAFKNLKERLDREVDHILKNRDRLSTPDIIDEYIMIFTNIEHEKSNEYFPTAVRLGKMSDIYHKAPPNRYIFLGSRVYEYRPRTRTYIKINDRRIKYTYPENY